MSVCFGSLSNPCDWEAFLWNFIDCPLSYYLYKSGVTAMIKEMIWNEDFNQTSKRLE